MSEQYLVKGATGFIGSNLARGLLAKCEQINIIARNSKLNWRLEEVSQKIKIHICDLLDFPSLERTVVKIKPTVIFHLAACGVKHSENETEKMVDVNLKGTLNLIKACQRYGFKLFVNTGSSSEYGVRNSAMRETDILEPINDYGITKAATTLFCQKISRLEKLPIVTFRLFSPYGYYEDPQRFVPYVISRALMNKPLELSDPNYVRDFIFIDDVTEAYFKAVETLFPLGSIINIGSGRQTPLRDIVQVVLKLTGSTSEIRWYVKPKQQRQSEPKIWQADITKARGLLYWKPRYNVNQGLKKTINWMKKFR